jgi:hypothetical protein
MATKVRVTCKGDGDVMRCEISGGSSGEYQSGSHDFTIGQIQSMVCFLTVARLAKGNIKVSPIDGDVDIDIDRKSKKVKKGGSYAMPSKTSRIVVREHP